MAGEDSENPVQDQLLVKVLRKYGRIIAAHWVKFILASVLVCFALLIPGWATRVQFGGSKDMINPMEFEELWSVKGGKQEKQIGIWIKEHGVVNDWEQPYAATNFIGKGDDEKDLLTRDVFLEILELDRLWKTLDVDVNGKRYTIWDLCARGILPDIENGIIMPCMTISPLHCFREEGEINHPSYQAIDPNISDILPGYINYASRPSLATSTDAEIKAIVSETLIPGDKGTQDERKGCRWNLATSTWTVALWGGLLDWSPAGVLTKARSLRTTYYFEGLERAAYRMSITKKDYANKNDLKEALKAISRRWNEICNEFNKNSKHVEVANLEHWQTFVRYQLEDYMNTVKWEFIISGAAAMVVFAAMVLVSWRHPMASRASVGFNGLTVVAFSQITSFGTYFLVDKYLNGPMLLAMPLLALGLGVDDMFVLLRYFSDLGSEFIDSHDPQETIGAVLAQAGPGVVLTSFCNIFVFFCGYFLPIPAMSDFCLCACFISFWNLFCMFNIFLPLLVLEIKRIKNRKPDPHFLTYFCQRRIMQKDAAKEAQGGERRGSKDATSSQEYSGGFEKRVNKFLCDYYAPTLARPVVNISLFLLAAAILGVCVYLAVTMVPGYSPQELFETDTPTYRAVEVTFTKFALFEAQLCFYDIEIPNYQREMLELYEGVGETKFAMPYLLPPYLTLLYYANAPGPNTTFQEAGFDDSWTNAAFAPFGVLDQNDPEAFYTKFTAWRQIPEDPTTAYDAGVGFVYADFVQVNRYSFDDTATEKMTFSFFPFSNNNLLTNEDFIESINELHDLIGASPLKDNAFAYGGVFVYWEVFVELERYCYIIMAVDAGLIFIFTLLISYFDFIAALITCSCCVMIAIEVFGLASWIMNFNIFVAAISLMGMGLSVEFIAHFSMAFSLAKGLLVERLGTAMGHTFLATLEGSISTFICLIPLAFAPTLFEVKYIFGIITMVIVIGLINGLIFLPVMLAALDPLIRLFKK